MKRVTICLTPEEREHLMDILDPRVVHVSCPRCVKLAQKLLRARVAQFPVKATPRREKGEER